MNRGAAAVVEEFIDRDVMVVVTRFGGGLPTCPCNAAAISRSTVKMLMEDRSGFAHLHLPSRAIMRHEDQRDPMDWSADLYP